MRFLIIADPLEKLKVSTDSTLAFLRELLIRNNQVFWAESEQLGLLNNKVSVEASTCLYSEKESLPVLAHKKRYPITHFHGVLIRKDPPFDTEYMRMCWLLSLAEPFVYLFNRATSLLRYHEKMIPLEAYHRGYLKQTELIATFLNAPAEAMTYLKFKKSHELITKSFWGFGGNSIQKMKAKDFSAEKLKKDSLMQPFQEEVMTEGDARIFFLNGKRVGHFTRKPKEGEVVSNIARGGTALEYELSKKQIQMLDRLGKFFKAIRLEFAGVDMIGDCISEVNITSPTGLLTYEKLFGKDLSVQIIDYIEKNAASYRD